MRRKHTHTRSSFVKTLAECHNTQVKFSYHIFHPSGWCSCSNFIFPRAKGLEYFTFLFTVKHMFKFGLCYLHDITEILLRLAFNTNHSTNQSNLDVIPIVFKEAFT